MRLWPKKEKFNKYGLIRVTPGHLFVPKGFAIICPACSLPLYRARRNIYSTDYVQAADFAPIGNTPLAVDGTRGICHNCGEDYLAQFLSEAARGVFTPVIVAKALLEDGYEVDIVTGQQVE